MIFNEIVFEGLPIFHSFLFVVTASNHLLAKWEPSHGELCLPR